MNPLKVLALFGLVLIIGFTSSCSEDEGEPAPTETIMEIVRGTEGLDSLQKYLEVYPDLVTTLSGAGDFTLFAPTNSAFIGLLQTEGFPQDITSINPDIIKNVLAYHLSASRYEASDVSSGVSISTQSQGNEAIVVNADGTLLTGSSNDAIVIIDADLKATNGVVHTVGSVLIPPSVGATLTPNLGKTSGALLLGADFSILASAIMKAEEHAATSESIPSLIGILAGTDAHTVFAPSNGTFEAASLTADSFDAATWYGLIATHVVMSNVEASSLTQGATLTAASGATLTVLTTEAPTDVNRGILTGVAIDANGDTTPEAQVAVAAFMSPSLVTSNGRIHVIAGVLNPN